MSKYVVDVEIKYLSVKGKTIAERKFLIDAANQIEAQKKVFNTINGEFGRKKIIKLCRSCEEVDLW